MIPDDYSQTIQRLCDYLNAGKVCILAGAGISYNHPSHVPLAGQIQDEILRQIWKQSPLLQELGLQKEDKLPAEAEFVNLLKGADKTALRFELLMQVIADSTQDLKSLLPLFKTKKFNQIHRFIAESFKRNNQVVTTNFDVLIEEAVKRQQGTAQIVAVDKDFLKVKGEIARKRCIFKIHGTLEQEESIKATLRQVGKSGLAFMWERGKGEVFERLIKRYHLLFLGYSGTDDFDIMSKLIITDSEKEVF